MGGWHLTNYLYPPFRLLKFFVVTDWPGSLPAAEAQALSRSMADFVQLGVEFAPGFSHRFMSVLEVGEQEPYKSRPELLQPPLIMSQNPERYEAWYGKVDRRCNISIVWRAPR